MAIRVGIQHVADSSDVTRMLAHMLGLKPKQISLEHLCTNCGGTDHGRPVMLIDGEAAREHISISRTPHWIAAAMTDGEDPDQLVGVDIETVKRVARHDLSAVAYTENEAHAIASLDDYEKNPAATQLWTAKEATTKLLGMGLRADLKTLECSVIGSIIDECTVSYPEGEAHVNFFSPHQGVLAAVASAAPEPVVWLSWGN